MLYPRGFRTSFDRFLFRGEFHEAHTHHSREIDDDLMHQRIGCIVDQGLAISPKHLALTSCQDERVTEKASVLKEHLDQAKAQLVSTGPDHGNVAMYRSTVTKLTEAMAAQTAAGAKSQALIKGLELKVKALERELARASSPATANEEHAQALTRQREADVDKMDFMRRQLDSALNELAKANQSICAGALSPDEEDPPVDDGDAAEEPGTPVLSDQEGDDDNDDECGDVETERLGAADVDANAGAVDPVLAAALAGIGAHNSLMFNITHNA